MKTFAALAPAVARASATSHPAEVRLFLQLVEQFCILGIKPADGPALLAAVQQMPGDIQMLWTSVLQSRLGRTDLQGSNHGNTDECRLDPMWNREVLQLVDSATLTCSTCGSRHRHWPELTTETSVAACKKWQRQNVIERGADRIDVYGQNFASVARLATNCVVVDRYAGQRLLTHGDQSGLAWFGRQLVSSGVQRIVLVTGFAPGSETAIKGSTAQLSDGTLKSALRIETRADKQFMKYAHDRFVLLQVGHTACTFSLGKGLEVFEKSTVKQESSFSVSDGDVVSRVLSDLGVSVAPHFA